jgi:hypothetical protein
MTYNEWSEVSLGKEEMAINNEEAARSTEALAPKMR